MYGKGLNLYLSMAIGAVEAIILTSVIGVGTITHIRKCKRKKEEEA